MRTIGSCFLLLVLCFAVFSLAFFSPGEVVTEAVAVNEGEIDIEVDLAIGVWPFPCQICCEQKRETRKCVRWCCPFVQEPGGASSDNMTVQAFMSTPEPNNVGYTSTSACSATVTTQPLRL